MKKHNFFLKDTGISKNDLIYLVNLLIDQGFNSWERREIIQENQDYLAYPCIIESIRAGEINIRDLLIPPPEAIYN